MHIDFGCQICQTEAISLLETEYKRHYAQRIYPQIAMKLRLLDDFDLAIPCRHSLGKEVNYLLLECSIGMNKLAPTGRTTVSLPATLVF